MVSQSPAEAKKHQLANQLFGGLSGPFRAPKSKQHRKSPTASSSSTTSSFDTTAPSSASSGGGGGSNQLRPPRQVAAASKKPKEPQVDLLLDLEGIDFSSPAPAAAPSAQEQTTGTAMMSSFSAASSGLGGGGGGLLANMEIRGATTQDTAPATSAPPTTRYSIHVP